MKDKKLQVFVSSTYTDLIPERQAAVEAILSTGNIPAGMELFAAGDETQMTVIERWIDESDVYLLILGGRYGSVDKKTGKSYTQLEYEYAIQKSKSLFAVVISQQALDEKVKSVGSSVIELENPKELKAFKEIVLGNLVKFCIDTKDIKIAIHETLSDFSYRKELVGWIRGDNFINSGMLAEEIARLTKENSELREKINSTTLTPYAFSSGLTFEQIKKLLKNNKSNDKSYKDLYDYLVHNGTDFAVGDFSAIASDPKIKSLITYRLVERNINKISHYQFTDDGHRFHLKTLTRN